MEVRGPLLTVANGDWGHTGLRAVHAVLHPAARILCDAFGRAPDAHIRVHPGEGPPKVVRTDGPYWMRLSARDTYWCLYAYQLAGQVCRVLANFDRVPHHRHKWFEESLCELASLFVLHRMAESFLRDPPADVLGARRFAPHFKEYADRIVGRAGAGDARSAGGWPAWLRGRLASLETNPGDRNLKLAMATTMLDSFLADESLWRDCGSLNLWDAADDRTLGEYLESWAARVGREGREARTPGVVAGVVGVGVS